MRNVLFRKFLLAAVAIFMVTVPSMAQENLCDFDGFSCCIGTNCGEDVADFHCHSVNTEGVQCWDGIEHGTQDGLGCDFVTGFNLVSRETEGVTAISCEDAGADGSVAGQLLDGVGGYNLFRTQLRKTTRPRLARQGSEEAESESEDEGAAVISEMATSVEVNDWTFRGISGETPGVRLGWRRQTESGHLFGISASYQDADPDFGMSSRLLTAQLNYGHTLGPIWTWSVSGAFSDFSGLRDETLIGATGLVGFAKYSPRGSVVSGGVVVQYLAADNLPDDLGTAGFGLAYGVPIGKRVALDFEGYAVSVFEGEILDVDELYTLSGMLSIYATPRFAVTLGYRLLEGIDGLDSDTFTFGASTRWK